MKKKLFDDRQARKWQLGLRLSVMTLVALVVAPLLAVAQDKEPTDSRATRATEPRVKTITMHHTGKPKEAPPRTGGGLAGGLEDVGRLMAGDKVKSTLVLHITPKVKKRLFAWTERQERELLPKLAQVLDRGPVGSADIDKGITSTGTRIGILMNEQEVFQELIRDQDEGIRYQRRVMEEYERVSEGTIAKRILDNAEKRAVGKVIEEFAVWLARRLRARAVGGPVAQIGGLVADAVVEVDKARVRYILRKTLREYIGRNRERIRALCLYSIAQSAMINRENDRLKELKKLKVEWDRETEKNKSVPAVCLDVSASPQIHKDLDGKLKESLRIDTMRLVKQLKEMPTRLTEEQLNKLDTEGSIEVVVSEPFDRWPSESPPKAQWGPATSVTLTVRRPMASDEAELRRELDREGDRVEERRHDREKPRRGIIERVPPKPPK